MIRYRHFCAVALLVLAPGASAQLLPVTVETTSDSAAATIGNPFSQLADLGLDFDDPEGLDAAALGLVAELVPVSSPVIAARLPSPLTTLSSSLPLLLTVEPPLLGGLEFRRRVHVDVHTRVLHYTAGSRYRLFKAPLGGSFRDITTAVEPGSVRTRGTTGGFSQFMVVIDLRPTGLVIDEKFAWVRAQLAGLPLLEANPIASRLDNAEAALAVADYPGAMLWIERAKQRVSARAGAHIPDDWNAAGSGDNTAGELLAGLDTLAFSIGFLRDYGP